MEESTLEPTAVERGLKIRREVLGDEYVDRATEPSTEVGQAVQELITGYCWGSIWSRSQLSRRERSLMTLSILAALNRPHEIALHVSGALNNGLSSEEIEEVFLHVAPYAGIPAAIDGANVARPILDSRRNG
tara:strand:- start:1335 stop:1730 length:396 start_codon:yes stop_codon:yes gene_type:complete